MAAETFSDAWNLTLLHLPDAPPLLVRSWVQQAINKAARFRDWGFLRTEAAISIAVARSFAVGVVGGSAAITSAALFVAGDVGRQFRVGTYPVYTIISFQSTSGVTLDRAYGEATDAAATGQVLDAYVTLPEDFDRFHIVIEPVNNRPIGWWFTDEELALCDPNRVQSDSGFRVLCARKPSALAATLGRAQYEAWPYPTAARAYPYIYFRQIGKMANTDPLPYAWTADLIKDGALVEATQWPGSIARPNPYFNAQNYRLLKDAWEKDLQSTSLGDDSTYLTDLATVNWEKRGFRAMAYSEESLRSSDADTGDFY